MEYDRRVSFLHTYIILLLINNVSEILTMAGTLMYRQPE